MRTPYQDYVNARTYAGYGCNYDQAIDINGGVGLHVPGSFATRYREHRWNAKKRSVGWEITFSEWVDVWKKSGLWDKRGNKRGCYCMARHGDLGPYKIGNVSIQLSEENAAFALSRSPASSSRNRTGRGRGWTLHQGKYVVQFCGKYLGRFKTQDEAVRVYAAAAMECGVHAPHLQKISPSKARNSSQQG